MKKIISECKGSVDCKGIELLGGMEIVELGKKEKGLVTKVNFIKEKIAYTLLDDGQNISIMDEGGSVRKVCLSQHCEMIYVILDSLKEQDYGFSQKGTTH